MDEIKIVEYKADWPCNFLREKCILEKLLAPEYILAIEHFGSTAIPGLAAKPIIDILIAVPSVELASKHLISKLTEIDYVFWAENPEKDKLFFVKGMPPYGEVRTHHVHVVETLSAMEQRLKFRDYLISNIDERDSYATLKRKLAAEHSGDREAYTDAKSSFVSRILKLAENN